MPDSLLQRLRDETSPSQESKDRVRASIQARIGESFVFQQAKGTLQDDHALRTATWNKVVRAIEVPAASLLGRLGEWLSPSTDATASMRTHMLMRLQPIAVHSSYTRTKWVAAFAVFAIAIRVSPVLLLAPRTIAQSDVLLIPTVGAVELSSKGLWQPVTSELTLRESVSMRTEGGEATVLLHDDGTVRLDTHAGVSLYDLSNRPEPALDGTTLQLSHGRIWVQGLLPTYVRGLTIGTLAGDVIVHNGSASLAVEDGYLFVQVWDHSVTVVHGTTSTVLVTGEQARFGVDGTMSAITHMPDSAYDADWVKQNLQRDAVHQRAVAQMQQERSAAKAGILPTSPLYTMKRVAERVDVLLTLDPDEKLQKQINIASTRLNEAVALVSEGSSTGATVQMEEYKQALQAIATGSGSNGAAQFLLRQEVAENAANLAATQTTDAVYSVKKAVLQASADLSVDIVDDAEVQSILLVDTLDALRQALAHGDTIAARASYEAATPYLALLDKPSIAHDAHKEAIALLAQVADQLEDPASGSGSDALAAALQPYLPKEEVVYIALSDEQVQRVAEQILARMEIFQQPRPRLNQLRYEIQQMQSQPDAGRILRQLYHLLPGQDILSREVREAIQAIRK